MTYKNLIFNNTNQFKNHQRGVQQKVKNKKYKRGKKKNETHLLQLREVRCSGQSLISVRFLPFGITAKATKMKLLR